jgi:hypothetical protein
MSQPAATVLQPAPKEKNDQRTEAIRAEQILTVARGAPVVLCSGIAAAILLALAVTWHNRDDRVILGTPVWLAVIITGLLIGIAFARKITKTEGISLATVLRVGRWVSVNGGVCGVIWGSIAWWGLPSLAPEQESFVLAGVAMIMVGGSSAHAAYRPTVRAFTYCLTLTVVAGVIVWSRDAYHLLYAAAFVLLSFVTLKSARNQEDALHGQIVYRLERDQLVQTSEAALAQAKVEREAAVRDREHSEWQALQVTDC